MQTVSYKSFEFSKGERRLDGLKSVIFVLGNKTYGHFDIIVNVEEGQGGDTADFAVSEIQDSVAPKKVYCGDLSARALTRSKGIHDAKIPYISPISVSRELVLNTHDRNYVYVELNVEGSVYLLLSKVSRLPPRLSSAADGPSSLPSPFILSGPDWPFLSTVASTLVLISALNHNSYSLPKHSCSEGPNHAAPSTTLLSASRPNTPCSSSHDRNQPSISEHLSTSTGD
ncbi:hypothetical protein BC827DRAFT_1248566 [Russula dissimulans]|nr:hypothetical protein BC827DRAFT_1248566 [Russula dissimulans]